MDEIGGRVQNARSPPASPGGVHFLLTHDIARG
jgi:hypothetical protein